jgi:hypothetical protein
MSLYETVCSVHSRYLHPSEHDTSPREPAHHWDFPATFALLSTAVIQLNRCPVPAMQYKAWALSMHGRTISVSDKHLSLMDTCHILGMVHLYKILITCSLHTNSMWMRHKSKEITNAFFTYEIETCCVPTNCVQTFIIHKLHGKVQVVGTWPQWAGKYFASDHNEQANILQV